MAEWKLNQERVAGSESSVLFIHGFGGSPGDTWAAFPALLATQESLRGWDVQGFGYTSDLKPDARGIWRANPDIQTIADQLRTFAETRLRGYRRITILAHSMGGLVAQRALLDDQDLRRRVEMLFLFGTPSAGLWKAWPLNLSFLRSLKRQVRDMARGSRFIVRLRHDWEREFGDSPPFDLVVVAGDEDQFVPRSSSHDPFPERCRSVVPGHHLSMVKATTSKDASLELVLGRMGADARASTTTHATVASVPSQAHGAPAPPSPPLRTYGDWFHQAALSIDRTDQWDPLVRLCRGEESGFFLVHGERRQNVDLFVSRVWQYLNEESGRHHRFSVVPFRLEFATPSSPAAWLNHLKAGLESGEGTADDLLRDLARRSPLFLVLSDYPLGPEDLNDEDVEAMADFLAGPLPELVARAAAGEPVRVLLALHYEAGETALKDRLDQAALRGTERHELFHRPLLPLQNVTWDHIEDFLMGRPVRPPEQVVAKLRQSFDRISHERLSFAQLVALLGRQLS